MENNDHEDIFIPIPEEGYAEGVRKCIMSLGSIEAFINLGDASKIIIDVNKYEKCKAYFTDARETLKNGDPLPRALPKTYPYLLGQFGSGFCYLVVIKTIVLFSEYTCLWYRYHYIYSPFV